MANARTLLKPTQKPLVMNLLHEAGFDVSQWKKMKGGSAKAASNPKYCYNWSFVQPGEVVAVCIWYAGLTLQGNTIVFRMNPSSRGARRTEPGSAAWNRRAADMRKHIEVAYSQQLPLRVIVVDGKQRNPADLKPVASKVKFRLLDPVVWAVREYDYSTGECLLVRDAQPIVPPSTSVDIELTWFEGKWKRAFIRHRARELRARREKIRETLRKTGRLACEVPNCGFDFQRRYGSLGKGYAQVHHLIPLSEAPKGGRTVALKDLAIVCANCHVMLHAGGKCRPLKGLISGRA